MDVNLLKLEAELRRAGVSKWDRVRALLELDFTKQELKRIKAIVEWLPGRMEAMHYASTGDKLIVEMTDSHLANTLAMYWRFNKMHGRWRYRRTGTSRWGVTRITGRTQHTRADYTRYSNEYWFRGFDTLTFKMSEDENAREHTVKIRPGFPREA